MAYGDQHRSKCCFLEWMKLQERDLSELLQALTLTPQNDAELTKLAQKGVEHFESYISQRSTLSKNDVAAFFSPAWCTAWENSLLWIAGCRPSAYIRLIYALSGADVELRLADFLRGGVASGGDNLGGLSTGQVRAVDELQRRTIREEDRLTTRVAGLQEDVADEPITAIVKGVEQIGELSGEIERALDEHEKAMAVALEDADKLRLNTVKEIFGILTPVQGVDFLAMSKKLHLCVHEWGKKRDQRHGRENC